MKVIENEELKKYNDNEYVWYACYGSNIYYDRFMCYINGDQNNKYSTKEGCSDKTEPVESRKYTFNCPIYFAGQSNIWGGGMAFLDYENKGISYGKIYKIKMTQFKSVLQQEQRCGLYDAIIECEKIDGLPVFTFTAKHKLLHIINKPSYKYLNVIKKGLEDLIEPKEYLKIMKYLYFLVR